MTSLAAREGYRLWAPTYEAETAVSRLEALTVAELGIVTDGRRILDVGCGTARRLREVGAALAVGVDCTLEMLMQARGAVFSAGADARALPFAANAFDVVWCRLMIGHVREYEVVMGELARVCAADGDVVLSDICAEAVAAGHRRTFRGADGVVRELEHYVHSLASIDGAAHAAALERCERRTGAVGPSIRELYVAADRMAAYDAQCGQPLVSVTRYRKQVR